MNIMDKNNFDLKADNMPNILRLELTNTCNLSCPHCRHHSKEKRLPENYPEYYKASYHISEEQVEKIFNEIGPYKPSVTLNVANEPLIAKSFKFAVKQLKKYDCSGTFNTNGLLLNQDMCEFLADQKYDSVNISIDAVKKETLKLARGITSIDKLVRNVKRLVEVRGNNPFPRVGVTFVIMPYNENEIPEFLNLWKDIADVIRFTGYITDKQPDMSVLPGVEMAKSLRVPCKQIYRDIVIRANGDELLRDNFEFHNTLAWEMFLETEEFKKFGMEKNLKSGETFIINLNGETYLIVRDVIIGLKVAE